jgi:nickel-dependent lactate racemase
MPNVSVPWGRDELSFTLPDHWEIQQVARPSFPTSPEDWRDRLAVSLHHPGTGRSLDKLLTARRGGKIVLVVEDATRHSPLPEILEVVLREIRHARVDDSRLEVFFATGMHPPMTVEQARAKLGDELTGLAWRSNPWHDEKAYVRLGRTGGLDVAVDRRVAEADLRIIISSVAPHLQAGFGGGYKMLFPGAAHIETIRGLHRLGIERAPRQLVGLDAEHNPMRQAVDAAGEMVEAHGGKSYAVQYLLDEAGEPAFVATGEVLPTHRMVAKQCSVACGILTPGAADVLVVNSHPLDYDLWQCFKCIPNTRWAVRPNGVIICLARCEGLMRGMDVPKKWPLSPAWMRRIVRLLGADALASLITRSVPRLAGDAGFFVRLGLQTLHRNPLLMVSPALHEAGAKFPGIAVLGSVAEAVDLAEDLLRNGQRRVALFPAGGVTFPIPPAPPPKRRG